MGIMLRTQAQTKSAQEVRMEEAREVEVMSFTQTAYRLGVRYHRVRDLVFTRQLEGWQNAAGRWVVAAPSVERLLEERNKPHAA